MHLFELFNEKDKKENLALFEKSLLVTFVQETNLKSPSVYYLFLKDPFFIMFFIPY